MSIYYSSVSKRTRKIDIIGEVAFTNFYGSSPRIFVTKTPKWNSFCTRAENNSTWMRKNKPHVHYVMNCRPDEFTDRNEIEVARWDGQEFLNDQFWDCNKIANIVHTSRGNYDIVWVAEDSKVA